MISMRPGAALALLLSGCLHPTVQECSGGGQTWVCPSAQACAQPPTYCSTPNEVGACQGKLDDDACSSSLVADGLCESGVCTSCSFDIAHCRYVGWNAMTSGTTAKVTAVAFTRLGEAYAGTDAGEVRHYLTSGWTASDLGMPDVKQVIAMQSSGTRVYALLNTTATINQRVVYLEGATWKALPELNGSAIYAAMWIDLTGDVFLVGATGGVAHYDLTAWTESTAAAAAGATFHAVWGTSASDLFAVGNKRTIVHYDGSAWSAVASPGGASNVYNAVWGASGEVFVAGTSSVMMGATPVVHAVGGGAFTAMPAPAITMATLAMYGASATDVWMVGNGGTSNTTGAVISHWDGVSWTQIQTTTQVPLLAVAGSEADEIFVTGEAGTILRYTGAAWATLDSPAATSLGDIWAAAPNEVFAVGNGAHHLATDRTWSASVGVYAAVTGRSPSDVVAMGTNSWSLWDGTKFPAASSGTGVGSTKDIAATPTAYYSVSDGLNSSPTGATWTLHSLVPAPTSAHGLWISPSNTFWVAAEDGIAKIDTSYVVTSSTTGSFDGVWGFADDDIYAVGTNDVRHYDGTGWTAMTLPTQAKLNGVWGRTTNDVFAVGVSQTVLHYHDGLWKQFSTPFTTGDLGAVSGAGNSVFMTSLDGKVYQLVETVP